MGVTEYVWPLGEGARKRHYHETRRGKVVAFAVQLEVDLRGQWVAMVRYDMAHGRAHVDIYETPTRKAKEFLDLSPFPLADEALARQAEECIRGIGARATPLIKKVGRDVHKIITFPLPTPAGSFRR